ncbi:hypothetical protein CPC08DRAFT_712998 [Agrocybe pediades]|nr:hypothetical protein CPC08DRAFT_712998 [Agrocybe pediades]
MCTDSKCSPSLLAIAICLKHTATPDVSDHLEALYLHYNIYPSAMEASSSHLLPEGIANHVHSRQHYHTTSSVPSASLPRSSSGLRIAKAARIPCQPLLQTLLNLTSTIDFAIRPRSMIYHAPRHSR